MELVKGCIVQTVHNQDREVLVVFPEYTLRIPDQDMLIRWKQRFCWKNSKDIGDGMSIAFVHNRPFTVYDLSVELLVGGLSIYQEYDELTDTHNIFLYKYPKGKGPFDNLMGLLDHYSEDIDVKQHRFTQLMMTTIPHPESMYKQLHKLKVQGALSFLFGLIVGYGILRSNEGILHNVTIQIPLIGSVIKFREHIDYCCDILTLHGMYVARQEYKGGEYNILQIHIDDWEILFHVMHWYSPAILFESVSKQELHSKYKEELSRFLADIGETDLLETITYSVLKMLTK